MMAERFLRELVYPLTDMTVLLAIVAFALLATAIRAVGLLGVVFAIFLLPALFRYLLMLLEARALARPTPVLNIELFSLVDNFWSLVPLVIIAVLVWGGVLLDQQLSPLAGKLFAALMLAILPASFAILAVTRSPSQALSPASIARMITACGLHYALAPMAVALASLVYVLVAMAGAPGWLVTLAALYALTLSFTFTGGLLQANGVRFFLSPEGCDDADLQQPVDEHMRSRQHVLNHAYGFFSRNNRAGAMAHIDAALQQESDLDEAYYWFFNEMLNWETSDGALLLAQSNLTRLLHEQRDVEAVKLISRCLLVNPRFRPLHSDVGAAVDAARRLNRDDLVRQLEA